MIPQSWEQDWQSMVRRRDAALARSRELQAAITASLRRRQPPPMELLREAERAEDDLNELKARLRDFLGRLG
jgi:hypothetical protein